MCPHGGNESLAESGKVIAPHRGVLPVDEAVVFLATLLRVREGDLNVGVSEMDDRVDRLFTALEILREEIEKAVLRFELLSVQGKRQAGVEVGVVPQHGFDELEVPCVGAEDFAIRLEGNHRPAGLGRFDRLFHFLCDEAVGKGDALRLFVAEGGDLEKLGEEVHRFDADPVQANRFFEGFAVVLRAGVDDRSTVLELTERDAATVVPDANEGFFDLNIDLPAVAHYEFIDAVVDDFFEQNVDAVVLRSSVPQFANVHPGTKTNVLSRFE